MDKEINVVEEVKDVVTNMTVEHVEVMEPTSSKAAWLVFGGVVLTVIAGVTVCVTKKIKGKKAEIIQTDEDDGFIDKDIENED